MIMCACKDRKSTRLNSSHGYISYAVFCLKKKPHKIHWQIGPGITTVTTEHPGTPTLRTRVGVLAPPTPALLYLFSSSPPLIFFFNDTATTEIYTLSLHDALPISRGGGRRRQSESCLVPMTVCWKC